MCAVIGLIGDAGFAKPFLVDFIVSAIGLDVVQAGIDFAQQFGVAFFECKYNWIIGIVCGFYWDAVILGVWQAFQIIV